MRIFYGKTLDPVDIDRPPIGDSRSTLPFFDLIDCSSAYYSMRRWWLCWTTMLPGMRL